MEHIKEHIVMELMSQRGVTNEILSKTFDLNKRNYLVNQILRIDTRIDEVINKKYD